MNDIKRIKDLIDILKRDVSKEKSDKLQRIFDNKTKSKSDLSMIIPKFLLYILSSKKDGVLQYVQDEKYKEQRDAIQVVIDLYQEWVSTLVKPDQKMFDKPCNPNKKAIDSIRYNFFKVLPSDAPYYRSASSAMDCAYAALKTYEPQSCDEAYTSAIYALFSASYAGIYKERIKNFSEKLIEFLCDE